jgi:hypothetical protein
MWISEWMAEGSRDVEISIHDLHFFYSLATCFIIYFFIFYFFAIFIHRCWLAACPIVAAARHRLLWTLPAARARMPCPHSRIDEPRRQRPPLHLQGSLRPLVVLPLLLAAWTASSMPTAARAMAAIAAMEVGVVAAEDEVVVPLPEQLVLVMSMSQLPPPALLLALVLVLLPQAPHHRHRRQHWVWSARARRRTHRAAAVNATTLPSYQRSSRRKFNNKSNHLSRSSSNRSHQNNIRPLQVRMSRRSRSHRIQTWMQAPHAAINLSSSSNLGRNPPRRMFRRRQCPMPPSQPRILRVHRNQSSSTEVLAVLAAAAAAAQMRIAIIEGAVEAAADRFCGFETERRKKTPHHMNTFFVLDQYNYYRNIELGKSSPMHQQSKRRRRRKQPQ